jgi:hypothetical protein
VRERQDDLERRYVDVARENRNFYFTRPYVDSHIRASLGRLREAYLQLYQVEDTSPDREWFQQIADSLEEFSTTFPARSRVLPLGAAAGSLKSFVQFPATWVGTGHHPMSSHTKQTCTDVALRTPNSRS